MSRQELRIDHLRQRILDAETTITRWRHVKKYTSHKSTKRLAERKIEMYEDRRDLWEERLAIAETK
jgi:hypothetical protein